MIVNIYLINGHSSLQFGIWTGFPSAGWYNPTSRRWSRPSWNREAQKLNSVLGCMSLPQVLLGKFYRPWPIVKVPSISESSRSLAACNFEIFFIFRATLTYFFSGQPCHIGCLLDYREDTGYTIIYLMISWVYTHFFLIFDILVLFLLMLDSWVMFLMLLDTPIALLITLDIFLTSSLILTSLKLPDV